MSSFSYFAFGVVAAVIMAVVFRRKTELSPRAVSNTAATGLIMVVNIAFGPSAAAMASLLQDLFERLAIPTLPRSTWDGLPIALVILVALLARDFADYWNHRLMHQAWLWPVHAVHHSDTHVNGTTTFRVHVLECVVMMASYVILLSWMQIPPLLGGIGGALMIFHNMYTHLDVDWNHGPLRYIIASPRFHRWHHADVPEAYGKNLANIFPFYDLMFGTYYVPGPCRDALGARDQGIPATDVAALTALPVTLWAERLKRWLHRGDDGRSSVNMSEVRRTAEGR